MGKRKPEDIARFDAYILSNRGPYSPRKIVNETGIGLKLARTLLRERDLPIMPHGEGLRLAGIKKKFATGAKIRRFRDSDKKQARIADEIGMSPATVSHYEREQHRPRRVLHDQEMRERIGKYGPDVDGKTIARLEGISPKTVYRYRRSMRPQS